MPNFSVDRFESLRRAGKTYSEMERILGVSRNTLKSYAHTHGVPKKGESKPVCARGPQVLYTSFPPFSSPLSAYLRYYNTGKAHFPAWMGKMMKKIYVVFMVFAVTA